MSPERREQNIEGVRQQAEGVRQEAEGVRQEAETVRQNQEGRHAHWMIAYLVLSAGMIAGLWLTYRNASELHDHERQQIVELRQIRARALRQHEVRDQWLLLTICQHQNIVQRKLHLPPTDCSALILKPVR